MSVVAESRTAELLPHTRKTIRADRLTVNQKYRAVNMARARKMARTLDLDVLGVFTVSEQNDGSFVVLDGQHRHFALLANGLGEWEVDCLVYHGLTVKQEARLFLGLNNNQKPRPMDKYLAGVEAQEPMYVDIEGILRKHGLKVSTYPGDGTVQAVTALTRLYEKQPDGVLLDRTLGLVLAVWGPMKGTLEKPVLEGVGMFLNTYGDAVDLNALVLKLEKFPRATMLVGQGRRFIEMKMAGHLALGVCMMIVETYNHGRQHRLAQLNGKNMPMAEEL